MEKLELILIVGGNVKCHDCYEKQNGIPQLLKNRITIGSRNSTPRDTKRSGSSRHNRDWHTPAHSTRTDNSQRQRQPKGTRRMVKQNATSTHSWILVGLKRKEILTQATINPEDTVLSEKTQAQEVRYL